MITYPKIAFRIVELACIVVLLAGCETIVNSVQGVPTHEIYPGQTVSGSLSVKRYVDVKQSLNISTAPSRFVYKSNGMAWRADIISTPTGRPDTFYGQAQLWKINTDYISEPTEFALIVQGVEFMPAVMIFDNATANEVLAKDKYGFVLPAYTELTNTVAGAVILDPKKVYYLTVQVDNVVGSALAQPDYIMMLRKN